VSARLNPSMTADTAFFWEGAKEHRLLVQRCADCHALRHPPRPMCPSCRSLEWDTVQSSGRGTVFSYVMPRHPPLPWFEGTYIVALVDLAEGTRLVTNLVGVEPADVSVGMPVVVHFEEFDDGLVLPMFTPEARS
jgi:hypothetical protein